MKLSLVKEIFAGFLRTRGLARHFRRASWHDSAHKVSGSRDLPPPLAAALTAAAQCSAQELLHKLGSHAEGLTQPQAEAIRDQVGRNEIEQEKPKPWWLHLWHCYKTPFDLLLTLLAVISWFTEDYRATLVIGSMVALSVAIRFAQERQSNSAAEKLKALVSNTATVLRRDAAEEVLETARRYFDVPLPAKATQRLELPIEELVPGDLALLCAGDMIPADCRIISAKDLFVSQAAMTGEALPVEKFARPALTTYANPLEVDNLVFMGSNVISGAATAVVIHTGGRTWFGALAARLVSTEREATQFQAGVNKVAWLLIRFMLIMAPLVLLINGFTKGDWMDAFLFALSVAVGLTPEMLPMIVTSTLAKGAVALSRQKVIVKRLEAIQNFGAMDVLCTDKTGTLTQDKIFLARHTDVWGEDSDTVLEAAYLNSFYQTGLKNLLDVAVLEHTELARALNPAANFRKVDEIPFDFQRRRMSVVVAEHEEQHLLICKGAVEEVLAVCSQVRHGEQDEALSSELLSKVRAVTHDLNEDGLRVVAVALKELPPLQETYSVADENGLTLVGYVAFLDPPKESTAPALKALGAHGVRVKVLTGDNELVTAKICREVGMDEDAAGGVLTGSALEQMTEAQLADAVKRHDVFARLTPAQKERIVRQLKANGHVVGFLGDGINDAPALAAADIGISVDSAVDIAKEAADIILLEKSLMVLEEGVIEGRKTFANMQKYIKMTASSNFGNVFSVLIASAFLPFLPMLPMHLLVLNLLYDISQVAIPFDNVDAELVCEPQRWNPTEIGRFMLCFGPVSSVFDILTYLLMWHVFGANTPATQTLFQSGWFIESLMTQTLVVHMIRTWRVPFVQSRPSLVLFAATVAIMAIGVSIPLGPLAADFKLQTLPWSYFPFLVLILAGYMALTQGMKWLYLRRFGWQ